jgi:hypothetical protein
MVVNLQGNTVLEFLFGPPASSGLATFARAATFITNGSDGGMQYTTVTTDFTQPGQWYVQAKYVIGGTPKYTSTRNFYVYPNIAVG